MQKSSTDDTTIDTAIADAIALHEADPDAHLGVGESIEQHKMAEVIDHPAGSIISDKYLDFSVLIEKLVTNKDYIRTNWESIDFWNMFGPGDFYYNFGMCKMYTTNTNNNVNQMFANADPFAIDFQTKNPVFEMLVSLSDNTSQLAYFGIGEFPNSMPATFIGFKVSNGSLYACWSDDSAEYTSLISDIDVTIFHTYRAVFTSGSKIEFYVDDVLSYTAITTLPDSSEVLQLWSFYLKTTSANYRSMSIKACTFFQDK